MVEVVEMANASVLRGFADRDGTVTLVWNMQAARLLSPDGKLHCLPCEVCGGIQWVGLEVVSIVCDECADLADCGPAVAAGEIDEAAAVALCTR